MRTRETGWSGWNGMRNGWWRWRWREEAEAGDDDECLSLAFACGSSCFCFCMLGMLTDANRVHAKWLLVRFLLSSLIVHTFHVWVHPLAPADSLWFSISRIIETHSPPVVYCHKITMSNQKPGEELMISLIHWLYLLFSLSHADNDRQKIMQDLQKKQQLLRKQAQGKFQETDSGPEPLTPRTFGHGPNGTVIPLVATPQRERNALQHANNVCYGFFISQSSSFGNMILPVLPRFWLQFVTENSRLTIKN